MSGNNSIKIHVYSVVRNEEVLLPYFLRHYSLFADRIFIIDDGSSDKTLEIAKKNDKVTLLSYKFSDGYNEEEHVECFTKFYKKYSRGEADWVICVDGDEFIYNKDIVKTLEKQRKRGTKVIKTTGYAMISKKLPKTKRQIYEELPFGIRERRWDKPCVFDPEIDIIFGHGRHFITAFKKTPDFQSGDELNADMSSSFRRGNHGLKSVEDVIKSPKEIQPQSGKLLMLHYRYLSRKYFVRRSTDLLKKLNISDEIRTHLMNGGLKFYDGALKSDLLKVV